MSATSRGSERIEADNYPTPRWATARALDALTRHYYLDLAFASILEPCVGEGAIVRELRSRGARGRIVGLDIRPDAIPYAAASGANQVVVMRAQDYAVLGPRFDLAITNPPYNEAEEIIKMMRPSARYVATLLRSAFKLNGFREDMPDELKLPQRPNFVAAYRCKVKKPDGGRVDGCGWETKVPLAVRFKQCPDCGSLELQRSTSDSSEYSWFVWHGEPKPYGITRLLPDTPLEERTKLEEAA
jgi:hypothetical protein